MEVDNKLGQIKRKSAWSDLPSIDYNAEDKPEVSYCPHCNSKLVLGPDPRFSNCQGCGRTGIPSYEAKRESEINAFVEPTGDPWEDSGSKSIMGLNDPSSKRIRVFKERDLNWRP